MTLPLLMQLTKLARFVDVYPYAPEVGEALQHMSSMAWNGYRAGHDVRNVPDQALYLDFMRWLEQTDTSGHWQQLAAPIISRNPIWTQQLQNTISQLNSPQSMQTVTSQRLLDVPGLPLLIDTTSRDSRLEWVRKALPGAQTIEFDLADEEDILRVHDAQWWQQLTKWAHEGGGLLDGDTRLDSSRVMHLYAASGALIQAAERAVRLQLPLQVCATSDLSSLAEPDRAMGGCIINHLAVATRWAQAHGVARVAIIDWSAQHAAGTESCFARDASVSTTSIYQHPHYPGTGDPEERGEGSGRGTVLNLPLPPGADGSAFEGAWERALRSLVAFKPQMVFLSASLDGIESDPSSGLCIPVVDYATAMNDLMRTCAKLNTPVIVEAGRGTNAQAYTQALNAVMFAAMRNVAMQA